jgi:surface antigen
MLKRLSAATAAAVALACVSVSAPVQAQGLQCAEFARLFSGIEIFGDAATWWQKAVGKYARGFTPESGSVLVFKPNHAMARGHVAVVSHVLTDRIIQVTHANWSPIDGARGRVEKDVTVVDVSPTGDWSQVKVWYDPSHNLGATVYPTYGFVYAAARHAADFATRVANAATGHAKAEVASAGDTPGY